MPVVPGVRAQMAQQADQQNITPEQLLMTAADMGARGQLYEGPTTYKDPRAQLKLPFAGGGRGERKAKRR